MIKISINVSTSNILKQLTNQTTIDTTKISPTLGVNVKLIGVTDPITEVSDTSKFFAGTVTRIVPVTGKVNATKGIYSGMVLDGIDEMGAKRTITITVENLVADKYGGYDKMFYTANLQDTDSASIYREENNDLILENATIDVFDNENVVLGKVITYKLANGTEVAGVVTAVNKTGNDITVSTISNGKSSTVKLTLIDATTDGFTGAALVADYL